MPTGMPGNIATGRLVEALDWAVNALSVAQLATLKGELDPTLATQKPLIDNQPNNSLGDIYIKPHYATPGHWANDKKHLIDHWLPLLPGPVKHGGWWEELQPIERILRAGFRQLVELLEDEPDQTSRRPVKTYWICAGSHFEVSICQSPAQFTMLLMTPAPPISRRRQPVSLDDEDIWVSKHFQLSPGEEQKDDGHVAYALTVRLKKPN